VLAGDENRQPDLPSCIGSRIRALPQRPTAAPSLLARCDRAQRQQPDHRQNALAQCVCDSVEGLEGVEFILPELEFDNIRLVDFAVTAERTNPNDNQYRLAMPLDIAKVRFNVKERKATGTDDASANVI
jgi:hypothetical protein